MIGFSSTGTWAIVLYVVGLLVLFGTFFTQVRAAWRWLQRRFTAPPASEPTPSAAHLSSVDIRILGITPTGGGGGGGAGGYVDFQAEIANYGTRQARCNVVAHVGDTQVECHPATLDLLVNEPPKPVRIIASRPKLGDLVPEFNNETTLYDQTLCVTATADDQQASAEWHEIVYTEETNSERFAIQQRKWRFGRGGETPNDVRIEYLSERLRRMDEGGQDDPGRYEKV
jgi:hypothetical protein